MKGKIIDIYKDDDEVKLFDFQYGNEKFEGIEAVKLEYNCRKNCKYRYECELSKVARSFDCKKKLDRVRNPYYFVTMCIVAYITNYIFRELQFGFFKKLAILLVALVILDMVCTFVESCAPKIYDWFLYKKLKKAQIKKQELEEAKRKEEEMKKQREEAEKIAKSPDYKKVVKAKEIVETLKEFSDKYDYGPNEEKINKCVEKCETILQKLQEDSSGYVRVAYLFEAYLPEFCSTLSFYADFIKAEAVTEEHNRILTECVDVILKFLDGQRVKAIFDKAYIEGQFKSSAETLKDMLKEELDK